MELSVLVGGVDALSMPEAALLTFDGLLVGGEVGLGTVPALASAHKSVLERDQVSRGQLRNWQAGQTYIVALVASTSNVALSTADLRAGVLGSAAPLLLQGVGDIVGIDVAAGLDAGGQDGAAVLGANETRKGSRSGDEEGGVLHCGYVVKAQEYQCLGGVSRKSWGAKADGQLILGRIRQARKQEKAASKTATGFALGCEGEAGKGGRMKAEEREKKKKRLTEGDD